MMRLLKLYNKGGVLRDKDTYPLERYNTVHINEDFYVDIGVGSNELTANVERTIGRRKFSTFWSECLEPGHSRDFNSGYVGSDPWVRYYLRMADFDLHNHLCDKISEGMHTNEPTTPESAEDGRSTTRTLVTLLPLGSCSIKVSLEGVLHADSNTNKGWGRLAIPLTKPKGIWHITQQVQTEEGIYVILTDKD